MKKKLLLIVVCIFSFSSVFASEKNENVSIVLDHMDVKNGETIPEWVTDIICKDYDSVKEKLGLKDTDKIFVHFESSNSFDDLLLKGKILSYIEFLRAVLSSIKEQYDYLGQGDYYTERRDSAFFGCREIIEFVFSDGSLRLTGEVFYLTPFGTMQISANGTGEEYTRKENIIQMNVRPDGKLVCPLEYEKFFKWFRNDKNVQVNQFWTKSLDKSIQYNCVTVMSMSEKDYENILQQAMEYTEGGL